MKRRNKKSKGILIVALILCITIGYAILTTTLNITGNSEIKNAKWDIHFDNLVVDSSSVEATTPATIDTNKTTINYGVHLASPGDSYSFTVDVVNEGTIDGMISTVTNTGLTEEQQKYIEYFIIYDDGTKLHAKDILKAGAKKNIKVSVKYKADINSKDLPQEEKTVDLTFKLDYVQADDIGEDKENLVTILKGTKGNLQSGDEVRIGDTEEFYVVSSDTNNTVLLAKYNLNVGDYKLVSDDEGIQSINASGYKSSSKSPYPGSVPFSSTSYWDGQVGEGKKYSGSYSDSNYPYVYDENSIVYNYVDNYINKLKVLGLTSIKGRLLTYQEAIFLGCSSTSCKTAPEWVYSTSYWLGSANANGRIENILSDGYFGYNYFERKDCNGVRVVIEISTTEL